MSMGIVASGCRRGRNASSRAWRAGRALFITVVLAAAVGCGDDGPSQPVAVLGPDAGTDPAEDDEIEALLFEDTVLLDADALEALERVEADGTLGFASTPEALEEVGPGRILVAGASPSTPQGLLRVVTAVTSEGEGLRLSTLNAPIQLAFRQLRLRVARTTGLTQSQDVTPPSPTALTSGRISETLQFSYPLFDGDGDDATVDDRVDLNGEIGGVIDYRFSLEFDWGAFEHLPETVRECVENLIGGELACDLDSLLPEAKLSFDVDTELLADAELAGAAVASFSREFPVLPPQTLAEIPLGPVVLAPVVRILGKLEGGASGRFSSALRASAVISQGIDLSSRQLGTPTYRSPELTDVDLVADPPQVTLSAQARASVGVRLDLLLYSVAGPYAGAELYGELTADPFATPCYAVRAGLDADLGVVLEPALPGLGAIELFDWKAPTFHVLEAPVVDGTCSTPDDPHEYAPGSGPDAEHYARPTFAPWSTLTPAPFDGSVAASPTGDSVAFLRALRTIDGRLLISGSHGRALSKLDDEGQVVWTREYGPVGERFDVDPLAPRAVGQLRDADLVLLAQNVGDDLVVAKLDQAGRPRSAAALPLLTEAGCAAEPRAVAGDGAGGAWLAGSCAARDTAWLLHVEPAGSNGLAFTGVLALRVDEGSPLSITTLTVSDGDAVVGGSWTPAGQADAMFAARVTPSGELRYAKRYSGCAEAADPSPTSAHAGGDGEVTWAGSISAHHAGFMMRTLDDGRVGFSSVMGLGLGASEVFVLNGLRELPTTGYVAVGSTVVFTDDAISATPGTSLLGLDARGRVQWSERYTLIPQGGDVSAGVASGFADVALSDDGGAVVVALAAGAEVGEGALWASKVFAKDGTLGLDPAQATQSVLPVVDFECALSAADLPMTLSRWTLASSSVEVESRPLTLGSRSLTN